MQERLSSGPSNTVNNDISLAEFSLFSFDKLEAFLFILRAMSIINSRRLLGLWEDAQRKPEWATTRLWEYIFKEEVFKGKMWSIASQQPPTDEDGDLRRVDLVPEHSDDNGAWARVLFFEAKCANATPSDLETVEFQAFTACCAYLHYVGKQSVWAVTAFAGKARLWAYRAGNDYLTPWVPKGDAIGAPDEYSIVLMATS
jgi:hypothetical protein